MTTIYQVPYEVYNQFIKYLETFKINFEIKINNSSPHTYGIIKIEGDNELQEDVNSTLNKLMNWAFYGN